MGEPGNDPHTTKTRSNQGGNNTLNIRFNVTSNKYKTINGL